VLQAETCLLVLEEKPCEMGQYDDDDDNDDDGNNNNNSILVY
jgi:hypothetical protein